MATFLLVCGAARRGFLLIRKSALQIRKVGAGHECARLRTAIARGA
jgi:hypothetical protein